jgi:phospholipid/cholesterol/gamma-HCH transport system substrate-binding protein
MSRHSESVQVIVGAFTLLLLVLVIAYSYGREKFAPVSEGYTLYASFNRIDGLAEGALVELAGIPVGTVTGARLDNNFRAQVAMEIQSWVLLPRDTSAAIHTDGLFGDKYVVLEPGADERTLKSGDRIDFTQDAVIVEELLDLIIGEGKRRLAKEKEQKSTGTAGALGH